MLRRLTVVGSLVAAMSCDRPTAPSRGDVSVNVSGLPVGAEFRVLLTGSAGPPIEITGSGTVEDVPAGIYTLHALPVTMPPDTVAVPPDTTVRIVAGRVNALALRYAYLTGGIQLGSTGVRTPGDSVTITLRGPGDVQRTVRAPSLLRGLAPGRWTIDTTPFTAVTGDIYRIGAVPEVFVGASYTSTSASVDLQLASGALAFEFTGLLAGHAARATYTRASWTDAGRITGTVHGDSTVRGIAPGVYDIRVHDVYGRAFSHVAQQSVERVTITELPTPIEVRGTYTLNSGAIRLAVTGVPEGGRPVIQLAALSAPESVVRQVTGDTVPWVAPGTYAVRALFFGAGGRNYEALTTDTVTVGLGAVADASIAVQERVTPFDAQVEQVHVTQAIQNHAGTVPLVAGREALVRVFLAATEESQLTPELRLRLYDGASTLLDTIVVHSSVTLGFPVTALVRVPGAVIRPTTRVRVDLDPSDTFADTNAANDIWPRGGAPASLDVRTVPPLLVRFVPVRFANAVSDPPFSAADAVARLAETQQVHPVQGITYDVRTEFTTFANRPLATDVSAWVSVASDIEALRVLEGAAGTHYVGVIRVNYTSGIAGIGFLPGWSSVIWNDFHSGPRVLAHELGHNFGRLHAPCGNPGGVDPDYPRPIAEIGDWGWDPRSYNPPPPNTADLMSYCLPSWTSAYTWTGVMDHRATQAASQALATGSDERVLLVSGTIEHGVIRLDPTFLVAGASQTPTGGPHRLVLRDAGGAQILAAGFRSQRLSEPATGVEQFTLAIPERALGGRVPASLTVEASGARAEWRSSGAALRTGTLSTSRRPDGRIHVRWNGAGVRGYIVRDAATGRIVTIARRSDAIVPDLPDGYEITVSDGLQSTTQRVRPAPR